ncbi:MAG TPA: hypothetical protein PL012_09500 [Candidatus Obscuribacter sp.]|nr:hypothetical protein [Candidatus Obscuribacter sp.]
MVRARAHDYGLELTQNSKVGWAFSLSRTESCTNATEICKRLCYGNGVRYQSAAQRHKRLRNYITCEFLLRKGGPELLAQNLVALVDQARPVDWLAAQISGEATNLPYTLRIHDVGDYFSCDYAAAWLMAIKQRPQCKFWFYTRSFLEPKLLSVLSELASQSNCQGFLSIDNDNFEQGLLAFSSYPGVWKLALMQVEEEKLPLNLLPSVRNMVSPGQIINFPYHRAGKHVQPLKAEPLTNCPQITTSAYPLQTNRSELKPCQSCSLCLPG